MQDSEPTSADKGDDKGFVVVERPSARVVLPSNGNDADINGDTDGESQDEDFGGEVGEGDYLEDFPDDTEELELIHARLSSLACLRLERFGNYLKKLCLRQNAVSQLDPEVFGVLKELEELDLYDNKIKAVGDALNNLTKLTTLDLSFNLLRNIPENITHLTSLQTVYFVQNRISKINSIGSLGSTLRSLELGGNRIRHIEGLEELVNLEELWLGKNKVSKLENLSRLTNLKILSMQSNRITKIEGLEALINLEQLYLSHNGIEKLEGLENNSKLKTIDLGVNFIPAIENISHLTSLEELWLNGNKIPDLRALEPQLKSMAMLETIYLEGNPCQAAEGVNYRRKIMLALPQLKQIDATFVLPLCSRFSFNVSF
ncbi:L domain-like protein [Hygrophoropsis aurantiaca]|uniref:L domain-like protein n=1 Tax=Hygrophoropsis aurantiaca TaxID=72124 RepID=A0ACB8ACP9_9AGAM|nr:L domain-like protein [Hygrophoropsis aurantiaca]